MKTLTVYHYPSLEVGSLIDAPFPLVYDSEGRSIYFFRIENIFPIKISPEICDKLHIPRRYLIELSYLENRDENRIYATAFLSVDITVSSYMNREKVAMDMFFPDTYFAPHQCIGPSWNSFTGKPLKVTVPKTQP